jgi:hypothetical protein
VAAGVAHQIRPDRPAGLVSEAGGYAVKGNGIADGTEAAILIVAADHAQAGDVAKPAVAFLVLPTLGNAPLVVADFTRRAREPLPTGRYAASVDADRAWTLSHAFPIVDAVPDADAKIEVARLPDRAA